jgi:hypothetical protein
LIRLREPQAALCDLRLRPCGSRSRPQSVFTNTDLAPRTSSGPRRRARLPSLNQRLSPGLVVGRSGPAARTLARIAASPSPRPEGRRRGPTSATVGSPAGPAGRRAPDDPEPRVPE